MKTTVTQALRNNVWEYEQYSCDQLINETSDAVCSQGTGVAYEKNGSKRFDSALYLLTGNA